MTIAREGVKICITDLDELKQQLRTELPKLQQPFDSGVVDSSRLVMGVLYTFSCNISYMLLSTGFKSSKFGDRHTSVSVTVTVTVRQISEQSVTIVQSCQYERCYELLGGDVTHD